jgi:two-component system OmpR family response regulator
VLSPNNGVKSCVSAAADCLESGKLRDRPDRQLLSRMYDDVYDRSIDVQILCLRRKIEPNPSEPEFIKTERGAGYIFSVTVDAI